MTLQRLEATDIADVMRIERLPGYDAFVGRWDADEHAAELASPDAAYFGLRDGDRLAGFVILQTLREPTVLLRRIAVETVEQGLGGRILRDVMDWVFERTPAESLRLEVALDNPRARRVYERAGFTLDGADQVHHLMSIPRARWADLRGR